MMLDRVRLLVACCTLITLTATVIHRQDIDGREGIHLIFMPCLDGEIVESQVWRSIMEQYKGADFSVLQSERARWLIKQEPDLAAEIEYRASHPADDHAEYRLYEEYMLYQTYEQHQEQEEYEEAGKHDDRVGNMVARRALRRMPHAPDLFRDDIPVAYGLDVQIADTTQYTVAEEPLVQPATWQDSTPTPPPQQA